jgi:predicted DCC family thiol-disulfide oxidoreductase YuxK
MKDIVFTQKRQKTELIILLVCFLLAIATDVVSIIVYKTEWKELYTQWLWILILTAVLYVVFLVLRLIFFGVLKIFKKH